MVPPAPLRIAQRARGLSARRSRNGSWRQRSTLKEVSASANVALRVLDAVDPLVEVSAVTSVDTVLSKIARGEDPTWAELNAVFGPGGPHEVKAVEAPAGPDSA